MVFDEKEATQHYMSRYAFAFTPAKLKAVLESVITEEVIQEGRAIAALTKEDFARRVVKMPTDERTARLSTVDSLRCVLGDIFNLQAASSDANDDL